MSPARSRRSALVLLVALALAPAATRAQAPEGAASAPAPDESPRSLDLSNGLALHVDEHTLTFRVLGHFRYVGTWDDADHASGFQLSLLRPSVRGRFFDGLVGVFLQSELAGDRGRILDAEVTLTLHEALQLTVGQFITPASRAFMTPVPVLLFPDFSPVSVAFREGRDVGGMLHGALLGGRLAYYSALVNGNGIGAASNDGAGLTLVNRVEVMPLGGVRYDNTQTLSSDAAPRLALAATSHVDLVSQGDAVVGGDAIFVAGPLLVLAEGYVGWQQARSVRRCGAYGQVGLTLVPERLQLGVRVSLLDPDAATASNSTLSVEGLVALYALGNRAKLVLRYAYTRVDEATTPATSPSPHALTVQLQGWL